MALDGGYLSFIKREIEKKAIGAKVEKIYQPSRDEIILTLGSRGFSGKLLLSASGGNPRVGFTTTNPENPPSPPMFCMLMRKYFSGARLKSVDQCGFERVLRFYFDSFNEMGDPVEISIIVEIMGRGSNIIMTDEEGRIIDAVRKSDIESASRIIQPGARYEMPPSQNKLNLLQTGNDQIIKSLEQYDGLPIPKAIMNTIDGTSPVVCREICLRALGDTDIYFPQITDDEKKRLGDAFDFVRMNLISGKPYMVTDLSGKPIEFSFLPITQYGDSATIKEKDSFSSLLDDFYSEREQADRMRRRSQDLLKLISTLIERNARKLIRQRSELEKCSDRDQLRISGELIKANIHNIQKGAAVCDVVNYYDQSGKSVRIKLNPALSPAENAQRYFKEYRKAHTAEQMLSELIKDGESEGRYLESVYDALTRAQSDAEVAEIRQELIDGGYIRSGQSKKSKQKPLAPKKYISGDGFVVLVGRNNRQNDQLTLKTAAKNDIWLHTKDIHGSHVIIVSDGKAVPDSTIVFAAKLAALNSKAADSQNVPVDFTQVRNVKKPSGAKPGMVIYDKFRTVYVTPDKNELIFTC